MGRFDILLFFFIVLFCENCCLCWGRFWWVVSVGVLIEEMVGLFWNLKFWVVGVGGCEVCNVWWGSFEVLRWSWGCCCWLKRWWVCCMCWLLFIFMCLIVLFIFMLLIVFILLLRWDMWLILGVIGVVCCCIILNLLVFRLLVLVLGWCCCWNLCIGCVGCCGLIEGVIEVVWLVGLCVKFLLNLGFNVEFFVRLVCCFL